MPVPTHAVNVVSLVLCLSLLALQNGCSNTGSGDAQAPATNPAATLSLALTTTNGITAIVADGQSTVPIRITVANGVGMPMSGVSVTFATTDGTLSSSPVVRVAQGLSRTDLDAVSRANGNSLTVSTDTNGIAQVLLTASTTAGVAIVTADVQGFRTHVDIAFTTAGGGPAPSAPVLVNSIFLQSISSTSIGVRGSGTNETSTLTFEARDSNGNLVQDPAPSVNFTLDSGGLGGGEGLSPLRVTAVNGQVTTTLKSGTKAGTVKVIAFIDANGNGLPDASEVTSLAISVVITGGPPWGENLGIVVQTLNIAGLVTVGIQRNVTVFLSDRFSNPVPDGTAVSFFSAPPSITGAAESNSSGGTSVATATFVSTPQVPFPPDSLAVVAASTLSGSEARVLSLAVNPFNANVVYAGTDGGGVFRTTNGLNTNAAQVSWTQVGNAQTGLTNGIVRNLQIDPTHTSIIYAATDAGVFRSIGSGDTWEKRSGRQRAAIGTSRITSLTLDPTNPLPTDPATTRTLYAGTQGAGVFRSFDSGFSWAGINNGISDTNILSLVALSPTTLYVGTFGGGVFRTFNATDTFLINGRNPIWCQVNTGLTSTVINTLATDRNRANIYAGTFLGGVFFLNGGKSSVEPTDCRTAQVPSMWIAPTTNVNTFDILNGFVSNIVTDPTNSAILYAATLGDGTRSIEGNASEGGVFRSIDSGNTWTRIPVLPATQLTLPPTDLPNNQAASLGLSVANPDALYVGIAGRNVVRLTPSTAIYTVINGTPPTQLTNNIFASTTILFSGNTQVTIIPGSCQSSISIGASQSFTYIVSDQNLNPLTGGSTVSVTTSAGLITGNTSVTIPDTQQIGRGTTEFNITLQNNTMTTVPLLVTLTVSVNSPSNGNKTEIASCTFTP